jgi:uncharacterized protein (TIGR02996 family)
LAERADELLDAVLASPEAMAPRLVLADWWMERGDPRGELVIVQHVLEDPSLAPERRDELEARERALLDQHEEQWLAELGLRAGEGTFIRGFVERIWLRPGRLDAAPVRCPARELHVSPEVELGWLLVHPLLARVRTLDLSEREPENAWGALACCERLRGLTSLSLRHCWLEDGALRTLTGSAHLGGLRRLNLQDNLLEDRDVPLLAGCEALPRPTCAACAGWACGPPSSRDPTPRRWPREVPRACVCWISRWESSETRLLSHSRPRSGSEASSPWTSATTR